MGRSREVDKWQRPRLKKLYTFLDEHLCDNNEEISMNNGKGLKGLHPFLQMLFNHNHGDIPACPPRKIDQIGLLFNSVLRPIVMF